MTASGPLALAPEIDRFRAQFERLSTDADTLVAPLNDSQFTWQPTAESWSVAQCIDHLNSTAREYLPMLDEGIADAIRRGLYSPGPVRLQLDRPADGVGGGPEHADSREDTEGL